MKKVLASAFLFVCLFIVVAVDACQHKTAQPLITICLNDSFRLDDNTSACRSRKSPSEPMPLPKVRLPDSKLPPVAPLKRP